MLYNIDIFWTALQVKAMASPYQVIFERQLHHASKLDIVVHVILMIKCNERYMYDNISISVDI